MAKSTPKPSMASKLNTMFVSSPSIEIQKQNVEEDMKEKTKQIEVAATEESKNTSVYDSIDTSIDTSTNTNVSTSIKENKDDIIQSESAFVIKKVKGKEEKDYFGLYLKPENNKRLDALTGHGKKTKSITGMSKSQLIEFFIEKGLEKLELVD